MDEGNAEKMDDSTSPDNGSNDEKENGISTMDRHSVIIGLGRIWQVL